MFFPALLRYKLQTIKLYTFICTHLKCTVGSVLTEVYTRVTIPPICWYARVPRVGQCFPSALQVLWHHLHQAPPSKPGCFWTPPLRPCVCALPHPPSRFHLSCTRHTTLAPPRRSSETSISFWMESDQGRKSTSFRQLSFRELARCRTLLQLYMS